MNKPRPRLTPENLISAIAYGTLSENNLDEEELHAIAYYLEELCSVKRQLAEKVQFGKFQSAEELYKAYQNLEREYTKSRQQLSNKSRN